VRTIARSPSVSPTLAINDAPTSGAMTIEPTTIAGESSGSPAVATSADSAVMA
jgi:hypothetical protein